MNKEKLEVGIRIENLVKQKGWNKSKFCLMFGISTQAYYKWISGRAYPDIQHLTALAKLFGVSVDYLLNGNEKSESMEAEERDIELER